MKSQKDIPTHILEKSNATKAKLKDSTKPVSSNKRKFNFQFLFILLSSTILGGFGYFFLESIKAPNSEPNYPLLIVATIGALVFIVVTFISRWYAVQYVLASQKLDNLNGQTFGVVTGMNRGIAGAVSTGAGWTYSPEFIVEFEVNAKTYTTIWELQYATNDIKMLERSEKKHIGEIIPVRFDVDNPDHAMAGKVRPFSISKVICFASGTLSFSYIAYLISHIVF